MRLDIFSIVAFLASGVMLLSNRPPMLLWSSEVM